jgi:two-component system, NtrC family, response regulator AtoC
MVHVYGPRLLMLDDDPNVREVVSALLTAIGYDCQTAASGRAGLLRLDEGGWDLVLTDLTMSEVTGWDVVEAVRRRAPATRVVLITGLGGPDVVRRASELGVRVITKPFDLQTLKAALVEALYA